MSDPIEPRPQPVLDIAGQLGGLAKGAFTAVFVLVQTIAVDGITRANIGVVGNLVGLAVAAVGGLVVFLVSLLHARKAALHVTPLEDPHDAQMRPLKVDPETYGRHAAAVTHDESTRTDTTEPESTRQWLSRIQQIMRSASSGLHGRSY